MNHPPSASPGSQPGTEMFKHQLFEEQVRLNPDAPALVSMTQHLTYGELNQLANATARRVQRLGAVPGDIAAVYLRRSVELVVAILALRKAGVACLHLDPDGSQQQVEGLLKLAEAKVILTHERHLKALHVPTAHVVCLDSLRDVIGEDEAGNPEVNLSTHHAESIFCTSGTTGAPKAVVWNFRRLKLPSAPDTVTGTGEFCFTKDDQVLVKAPVTVTPIIMESVSPLLAGACIVLLPPGEEQDPTKILSWILRHRITVLVAVPTQLRLLVETGLLPECRSLRVVLSFGEVFPPLLEEKIRTITSAHLILFYGATEAPSLAYRYSRKEHLPAGCNIGRPGAGKIIRVLNAEGQILPMGTPGELHVGGAGLSQGYFKNEALTRERFIPDPLAQNPDSRLFKTGDRGRILPDGSIEFLGREDDLVKIRGFRVEVNLVEQALNALPGISHAAAFAWDDGQGNKFLTGYLVPGAGTSPNLPEWRRALAETLPSHAIPGALVVLDRLPTSASGKVVKTALPPPHFREAWIDHLWEAPTDPLETQIAGIWSEVLAIDRIGRQDTFFELGGTSLRALSLLNKISTILKVDLPPIALLENPTLAVLSERVCTCLAGNKHRAPQSEFLFTLRKEGSGPPLFILPGGWGGENELLVFAALLRKLKTDRPVFGIPSRAMDPSWDLPSRLETQAEAVFNAVRGVQPAGPYVFIGECLAGVMAAALAARAEALGHPSGLVILLDARVGTASTTGDQVAQGNNSSLPERIQHYYCLLKQHQPSAIDHRVELILSSEINRPEAFADGWRTIARSGMAVHRVSGTHDSYIREDAEETARLLENLIPKG